MDRGDGKLVFYDDDADAGDTAGDEGGREGVRMGTMGGGRKRKREGGAMMDMLDADENESAEGGMAFNHVIRKRNAMMGRTDMDMGEDMSEGEDHVDEGMDMAEARGGGETKAKTGMEAQMEAGNGGGGGDI